MNHKMEFKEHKHPQISMIKNVFSFASEQHSNAIFSWCLWLSWLEVGSAWKLYGTDIFPHFAKSHCTPQHKHYHNNVSIIIPFDAFSCYTWAFCMTFVSAKLNRPLFEERNIIFHCSLQRSAAKILFKQIIHPSVEHSLEMHASNV